MLKAKNLSYKSIGTNSQNNDEINMFHNFTAENKKRGKTVFFFVKNF